MYPRSSPTDQMFPGWADMGISALLSPEPRCLVSSRKHSLRGNARQLGSHGGGSLACRTRGAVAGSSHGLSSLTTWPVVSTPGPHPQGGWDRGLIQRLMRSWPRPGGGWGQRCAEGTAWGTG